MSHFSVLVTGDNVEAALEPFDENRETPRYLKRTREQIISDVRKEIADYRDHGLYAEFLADKAAYIRNCSNASHLVYLFEEFPKKLSWTDEDCYQDGIRWVEPEDVDADGAEWSEYNPNSKWDYWRIGGRWAGTLRLKTGRTGRLDPLSWEWRDAPANELPDAVTAADVAVADDVDLELTSATFAVLHEGNWYERGEMGWWGVVHDEKFSEDEWPNRWAKLVADFPADLTLTVVDCHI